MSRPDIVVAGLIWFDTQPAYLERLVLSLRSRVDLLVAVDGCFEGLRDDPVSPVEQYDVLHDTVEDLEVVIYKGQTYRGEPEKRTAVARVALRCVIDLPTAWEEVSKEMGASAALLVIDGDEWLETDIDWSKVKHGVGAARVKNYDGDVLQPGDHPHMRRIFPLTDKLTWGPQHFDVRDGATIYMGHGQALTTDDPAAFDLGHQRSGKKIEEEYHRYNDTIRHVHERKAGRVVTGDETGVLMKVDRRSAHDTYNQGDAIEFTAGLTGEAFWARVGEITEPDEWDMVTVRFDRVTDEADLAGLVRQAESSKAWNRVAGQEIDSLRADLRRRVP